MFGSVARHLYHSFNTILSDGSLSDSAPGYTLTLLDTWQNHSIWMKAYSISNNTPMRINQTIKIQRILIKGFLCGLFANVS